MKRISFLFMSLLLLLPLSGCKKSTPAVTDPNAVARVGDATVTKEAFEAQLNKSMKRYYALGKQGHPAMEERIKSNILRRMTDNLMFEQKAKQLGIEVSAEAIDQRFNEQKARFGKENSFEEYLKRTNNTEADLKADIRFTLLREEVLKAIGGNQEVTEAEVRAYYDANSDRYVEPEEVHARHILVRIDSDKFINNDVLAAASEEEKTKLKEEAKAKAKEAAMNKIKEIEARVKAEGADFEAIAKETSEGPTAPKGGDLGFFSRKRMVEEFSNAAFALNAGEISDVVETRYGLHLIQVVERKAAVQKSFDDVKEGIKNTMENRKKGSMRRDVLRQLREEYKPEIFIEVKDFSPDKQQVKDDLRQQQDKHHRAGINAVRNNPALAK